MVEDNICAVCKKCCTDINYIGLISEKELEMMRNELNDYNKRTGENRIVNVKEWTHEGIFEILDAPCPAFIDNKCLMAPHQRPCTCLLFPFRPDFDEGLKEWHLDLATTKCPGSLSFAMKSDEAIKLFKEMRKDGRWNV